MKTEKQDDVIKLMDSMNVIRARTGKKVDPKGNRAIELKKFVNSIQKPLSRLRQIYPYVADIVESATAAEFKYYWTKAMYGKWPLKISPEPKVSNAELINLRRERAIAKVNYAGNRFLERRKVVATLEKLLNKELAENGSIAEFWLKLALEDFESCWDTPKYRK